MASRVLDKSYDPHQVEEKWYRYWTEHGYFRADENSEQEAYSIVIPPPNVTGVLHIGHALNNTLQDILIRFKRMEGYNVLWMPGTDHAGIATQNVVEKQLLAEGPRPACPGQREVHRTGLEMEGTVRRNDHQPVEEAGGFLRLEP